MGQIRKRRTFYRIRYYRRGQLIAGTTEHYEMGGRANAPAETGGRHCGRRPDHRPVERLTFDDAVEDVLVITHLAGLSIDVPPLERQDFALHAPG
jgi:hypothetical protein